MIDFSIIFAGFGGQGILSAGKMAAEAALYEGKEVSWFPSYGPEMRGGTANCSVVISDSAIGSPVVNDADVVICLNQPSMEKFEQQLKPGGLLIIDSSLISIKPTRTDIKFIPMKASDIASELGKMMFAPISMVGCLSTATGCFSRDSFEKSLYQILPERKHGMIPANMTAFDKGAEYAK
ncbi:MAG: 2-oxoacid:acceptor oxidoreductase family protein [Saccharofermentans sp.]|jgi:2-oxoglutarate ferredoxin oxidoreductase subunit gamma|nr:2-oxoacid:acceptor oxidoreductase family protein [Mageeibacillus sp.]MCI1263909.1 2-oxoacid:acceptor oxidoreductase family protein [Saccharofermentans sp.]MCI1275749.1 2-oxoacid:acceptor oxidoreductase family protein [Saccharofermentans sp.]MCI1769782.1 2-oxoacid:acceptor oxidoreductase family protein [Mageeibacillus sp.]MCI2043741.1 2-oxoacid:acceptor oxidoreductase family protein [Mageeibacillus sp.]